MSDMDDMLKVVIGLKFELSELQRKQANMLRVGTVKETDAKKGYQVDFGNDDEGKPIPSAWFPHPEQGGAYKTWRPLTKGQIVFVHAPFDDQRQAFITPRGGFSDENKQPSEKLDENVETYGKVKTTWKTDSTAKQVGDKVSVTTGTEKHTVVADATTLETSGSKVLADTATFRATKKVILASG